MNKNQNLTGLATAESGSCIEAQCRLMRVFSFQLLWLLKGHGLDSAAECYTTLNSLSLLFWRSPIGILTVTSTTPAVFLFTN